MPTIAQLTAVIEAQDQFSSTFNRLEAATSAILSGALADLIRRAGEVGFAFDAMREQAEIAFTNLLGSGEEARNFLDELAAFAAQTPFEFPDLLRAAQRFKAMGFESHQVIPILKSVGDAVAALGGNAEQVNRVTTALIQMRAKGKVSAEEMMQLAEAGIPAWEILARKIGTDIPTAMKRAEKGGVDANTAIAALVEGMNERFGGMMEQQARTFQGLVSTVRDSARFIIGDALQPMFENARKGLEKLVDILPTVAGFIRNLNPEILAVAGTFVAVFGATGVVIAGAAAVVAFLGGPLTLAILGVSATVAAMAAAVALNIDRLSEIFGAFSDAARIEFADVAAVLGATVDAFQLLARGAITVLDVIVTNVRQAAFLISNTFRALAAHIKDFVVGIVTGNLPQLVSGIQTLQQSLADIGRAFGAEFSALRHRVARDLELMGEHFQGKFAEQFYDAALQAGDSVNTFRADIDRLVADLRKSAAAAGNKANALGRAGGAAKAAAKETRELTGAVNDYLRAAGNQLRVTEEFIKGRSAEARALIEQARAYFTLQEALDQLNLGRVSRGLAALSDDIKVHGGVLGVPIAAYQRLSKEAIAAVERLGGRVKAVFPAMAAEIKETGEAVSRFPDAAEEAMRRFGEAAESGMKALEREFEKLPDRLGKTSKDFGEWVREQARLWDSLKGLVGEALAGVIATISRMFGAGLAEAERWTGRIVGVIDTLPGAFGDAARQAARTVSEWADFFDSVLKLLHEFNAKIPASLGELVKVVVDKMGQLNLAVFGKLRELGVGIAATLGGILGVGGQGPIGGAISGGLLGFGIGKLLHGIFNTFLTSILPGLGAAVGGIIGLFKGLFGGKSKEQQEAERLNLERLKQDLQKQATDIANTAISAMRNALDLFKELEHFTGVPKKAISRFFAALEITLRDFLALSVKFKFELIEAAGKFAEAIAPAIELIGAAVQAFALLRGHEDTPVSSINAIASDLEEAGLALVAASDKFEREHLGQIKKFSKKMLEGVSLLQAALEFFKGLREHADTPKETLALFFNDLDETLALLRERAESWGKHALNVIRDFSVRVSAAVEGLAAPLEFFKGLREHTQSAKEQLAIFFTDLDELLAVLAARAKGFSVEALAEVEVYARNIARIPALLVEAAEFFRSLRDADDLPQQAAQNLITDLTEFLDLLKRLNELAASALVEADGFRSMAQKVADSLRAGVEAIAAAGGALAQAGAWRRASLTPQAAPPASRSQTIYVTVQVDARSIREIQDIITLFDSLPLAARQAAG